MQVNTQNIQRPVLFTDSLVVATNEIMEYIYTSIKSVTSVQANNIKKALKIGKIMKKVSLQNGLTKGAKSAIRGYIEFLREHPKAEFINEMLEVELSDPRITESTLNRYQKLIYSVNNSIQKIAIT